MTKLLGRPKTFNKDDILAIAMDYFWAHGYEKSSLDDLLKAMGIKKSSFYNTFKSKEALLLEVLDSYMQYRYKQFNQFQNEKGIKYALLVMVKITISDLEDSNYRKGCLVVNSGKECYGKHHHLSHEIARHVSNNIDFITDFVEKAKNNNEIKNPLPARVIASRYLTMRNGLAMMIQAGVSQEVIDNTMSYFEELVE